MTIIESTLDLPVCDLRMYQVKDEAEAATIGDGYLFQSKIVNALYLFIPVHNG